MDRRLLFAILKSVVFSTLLFEILSGLGYLHDNGHIHRDIKAGNILLDPNGKAALSDFGVSSWLVHAGLRRRTAKTFVGTPYVPTSSI